MREKNWATEEWMSKKEEKQNGGSWHGGNRNSSPRGRLSMWLRDLCDSLLSFSGARLHQECLPWLCTGDIAGGSGSSEGLLATEWSVRATSSCLGVISAQPVLAWTHPHTPAVSREAWGWRVSLYRLRTFWGSLVRVCPTIQRLPVPLSGCLGGTPEFLWLSLGLRKCAFLYQSQTTGNFSPVWTLWDICNVTQQGDVQHHEQG